MEVCWTASHNHTVYIWSSNEDNRKYSYYLYVVWRCFTFQMMSRISWVFEKYVTMALALLQYRSGPWHNAWFMARSVNINPLVDFATNLHSTQNSFRAQDHGLWVSLARVIKSRDGINSLAPRRCVCNLESVIFKFIQRIDILRNSCEITIRWMPQTWLKISHHCFRWCRGAVRQENHYPSQC